MVGYKLASDTSGDFTTIPGVSVFSAPSGSVEDIDQTCIAEDTKRYLQGAWEGNEITITIHHYTGDATQQALIAAANSGSVITAPQDASISETIKRDVVGKLNGKPTWTFPTV